MRKPSDPSPLSTQEIATPLPPHFAQLTRRQQRFVLEYVRNGGNASQAARDAGYSASCSKSQVYIELQKPKIREAFAALLELCGITNARLLQTLFESLHAHKQQAKYDFTRHAWAYSKRFVDHETRLKAAIIALKLQGAYPKEATPGGISPSSTARRGRHRGMRRATPP